MRRMLLGTAVALALVVPSTGFAVVGFGDAGTVGDSEALPGPVFDLFTPSSIDPDLAARVVDKAREHGIRFTPAGTSVASSERTVTVAVRIDGDAARAITIRPSPAGSIAATASKPGSGAGIAAIHASRFNLGTARGYQSFARPHAAGALAAAGIDGARAGSRQSGITLPDSVKKLAIPDLSDFEPSRPGRKDQPGRLQPRVELEGQRVTGRSQNTLGALGSQTVDVGGSFRLSRNLDVTAGVRLSQEHERLDPVADSVHDSQAVYVGTQIRF